MAPLADPLDTATRRLAGRVAAHTRWARENDRTAATAPARAAFNDAFERQADPDGVLDREERVRRADHLRRAYFARLALRSAQARRRARDARAAADDLDHIAAAAERDLIVEGAA